MALLDDITPFLQLTSSPRAAKLSSFGAGLRLTIFCRSPQQCFYVVVSVFCDFMSIWVHSERLARSLPGLHIAGRSRVSIVRRWDHVAPVERCVGRLLWWGVLGHLLVVEGSGLGLQMLVLVQAPGDTTPEDVLIKQASMG